MLYEVTIAAERQRVDQVRRSLELCLEAAPLDEKLHARLALVATWLLRTGIACGEADGAVLTFRLGSNPDSFTLSVSGGCASEEAAMTVRALGEGDTVVATSEMTPELESLLDAVAEGTCTLHAMTDGGAFRVEATVTGG